MKIIAGTFGVKGAAFISGEQLHIESSKVASYKPQQIKSIELGQHADGRFSMSRALIGAFMLALLLGLVFGGLGIVAGIILGALGGFAVEKTIAADVEFADGNKVRLLCTDRAANKLIRLKG